MGFCRRSGHSGVYGTGAFNASGADYAELFEWADGNPDHQDRAGLFVTLQGDPTSLPSRPTASHSGRWVRG